MSNVPVHTSVFQCVVIHISPMQSGERGGKRGAVKGEGSTYRDISIYDICCISDIIVHWCIICMVGVLLSMMNAL